MHGMALLLIPAQRDQSRNFPADCQTHYDEREYLEWPAMADLRARYPSRVLIRSILRMFPKRGNLPESSVVRAPANHTTPSTCQSWYFHHLVLLYHLNRPIAWEVERFLPQLRVRPAFSGAPQNRPAILIRRYVTFLVVILPLNTCLPAPACHQFLFGQSIQVNTYHRLTQISRHLCQYFRVLEMGGSTDNSLGPLYWIPRLEDA